MNPDIFDFQQTVQRFVRLIGSVRHGRFQQRNVLGELLFAIGRLQLWKADSALAYQLTHGRSHERYLEYAFCFHAFVVRPLFLHDDVLRGGV
jgi:hypothetical protein